LRWRKPATPVAWYRGRLASRAVAKRPHAVELDLSEEIDVPDKKHAAGPGRIRQRTLQSNPLPPSPPARQLKKEPAHDPELWSDSVSCAGRELLSGTSACEPGPRPRPQASGRRPIFHTGNPGLGRPT